MAHICVDSFRNHQQMQKKYVVFREKRFTDRIMLVVEQYFPTGFVVYLWSKYVWQQLLERRQRNILNAYRSPPAQIREIIDDEQYEVQRKQALHRSSFETFKGTLDVSLTTSFILFRGFRKLWDKSSEIVAYFNIEDTNEIIKNALFLTMLTSGTFIVTLPFVMLELYTRQSHENGKRVTVTSIVLNYCVAQTLLFPFVCLFIAAFKFGGNNTLLWVFGFVEFQLFNDLLEMNSVEPLPDGELRNEMIDLTGKYKFSLQEIFVTKRLNGDKLVAVQGFPFLKTIILNEKLALGEYVNEQQTFNNEEIKALVARELSHWKRGHPYINFIVNQTRIGLYLYTMHRFINCQRIYEAFYFETRPLAVGLALLQFCPLFDLYNFIGRIISRKLEFVADKDVKTIHGDVSLKRAILKMDAVAKYFPIQDSLYSTCYSAEASSYERIIALNESDAS